MDRSSNGQNREANTMLKTLSRRAMIAVSSAILLVPASSIAAETFYSGKTLTIIAGYQPGGGIDGHARLIARHLGKFIPGNPDTMVRNISGAAGGVAANHMYNRADRDGLTLAIPGRSWMLSTVYNEPGVRFEPLQFTYIGSPGPTNNKLWLRADLGIKTVEDLKKSDRKLVAGALALRATNGIVPRILNRDGWPIDALPGYKGTSSIMLALEQKEVDAFYLSVGTIRSNRGDLIDDTAIVPVLQSFPIVEGLPVLRDLVSEEVRPLLRLATATDDFGVPLIGPPEIPADRLAALQKAFMEMARDEAYIADAKKMGASVGNPTSGPDLHKMIEETITGATPDVVKKYDEYTQ